MARDDAHSRRREMVHVRLRTTVIEERAARPRAVNGPVGHGEVMRGVQA